MDISLTITHTIDFTNMKNFSIYYQIKRLQCLVLPTLFFFMVLFIINETGLPINPFNAIITIITILLGYGPWVLDGANDYWNDWLKILRNMTMGLVVTIYFLYLGARLLAENITIDEQINEWILVHIGEYFSDCCFIIVWVILLVITFNEIMPAINLFYNILERNWYLENDAPNSEKGEVWIFYKNGKLIITSPLKEGKEISHIYSWKYNPQMKSIMLLSEERTQVFSNFNVQTFLNQTLSFTTNQQNSLYQFSSMMPQIVNMAEEDNDSKCEEDDENQYNT